jgi:hypothetical protein
MIEESELAKSIRKGEEKRVRSITPKLPDNSFVIFDSWEVI